MHRTTVNLPDALWLRVRNLAEASDRTAGAVVAELLEEALEARSSGVFLSHGAGEADVEDLGENTEKYLREGLG